jgi:hypothetical protein
MVVGAFFELAFHAKKFFGTAVGLARLALGPGAARPAPIPIPPRRRSRLSLFRSPVQPRASFLSGASALGSRGLRGNSYWSSSGRRIQRQMSKHTQRNSTPVPMAAGMPMARIACSMVAKPEAGLLSSLMCEAAITGTLCAAAALKLERHWRGIPSPANAASPMPVLENLTNV